MNIICLLSATILFAFYSIFMKYVPGSNLRVTMFVTSIFAALVSAMYFAVFLLEDSTVSGITVMWAILKGIIGLIAQVAYFVAMQKGPLSYTTFIFSASMLVPALGSAILWKEEITPVQWCGIVLFLIAFYMVSIPGADKGNKIQRSWLPLCLLAFFTNGLASILVKAQQLALNGTEGTAMMMISYGVTCVFSLFIFIIFAYYQKEQILPKNMYTSVKKAMFPIIGVAFCNGVANGFVTYLSSRISAAWLFPCVLGGSMILVTVFSVIVLKDKINKWGKLGIIAGLIAMFIMNMM